MSAENAMIDERNGKPRSIRLIMTAAASALRIGEPTGDLPGVRFSVREKLDCGAVGWKHHPRATETLE